MNQYEHITETEYAHIRASVFKGMPKAHDENGEAWLNDCSRVIHQKLSKLNEQRSKKAYEAFILGVQA